MLDKVRVDDGEGQRRPLNEFASVTAKGGKELIVTVYQEDVRTRLTLNTLTLFADTRSWPLAVHESL